MPRGAAAVLAVALALTACSTAEEALDDVPLVGPSTDTPAPSDPASPPAAGETSTPAPGPSGAPSTATPAPSADATTPPPGEDTGSGEALTPADDAAGVGTNARAILRRDRPTLVVEIDVQDGVEVDQAAVDHLASVLGRVVDKPGGIVFEGGNTFEDDRTSWTADDLRSAVAANRTTATTDERVSVHVLYVAGSHADDGGQTNAIGLAYSASTVAIFPQRWQGMVSLLGSSTAIERAVLVHELGHLMGLVNIGYQSDIDHEDPDHPGHSSNRDSVMFHAIESTLIGQAFNGPPPDQFDDADRSDLEGLRTGRL